MLSSAALPSPGCGNSCSSKKNDSRLLRFHITNWKLAYGITKTVCVSYVMRNTFYKMDKLD